MILKVKSIGLTNGNAKKIKKDYGAFYNLYCNFVSALFIESIKEAQKYGSDRQNNVIFSHGTNSDTLLESFLNSKGELPDGQKLYVGIDFAKFDASRSELILKEFDNVMLEWFMKISRDVLEVNGYDDDTFEATRRMITQTTLEVTYKDSKQRPLYTAL